MKKAFIAQLEVGVEYNDNDVLVFGVDCHHHLRNVWIKAMVIATTKYLSNILAGDLSNIHFRYCVTTNIVCVLSVDKEFSLPANYP